MKNINIDEMLDKALEARKLAYTPYSNFKVGACILLSNGNYICGSNVENASYGLTSCAERNTLFQTYNLGYSKNDIKALLIVGDTEGPCSPCGACRQVISELTDKDMPIILANLKREYVILKINDLLPYSFTKDDLDV